MANDYVWCCRRCGSDDVEGSFWVKLNTQTVGDSAGDSCCVNCGGVQEYDVVEISETERDTMCFWFWLHWACDITTTHEQFDRWWLDNGTDVY